MKASRILLALVAIAVAGGAWLLMDGRRNPPQPATRHAAPAESDVLRYPAGAPQLSAIHTEPVKAVPLPLAEPLNARVVYNEDVTARISAPIAGRVVALKVQAGDRVRAGQTLLVLDSPDLGSALSDLDKARAGEARQRMALERARTLYRGEAMARKDMEAAEADYASARAETRRASLRLNYLMPGGAVAGGEGYPLRSPVAGVVAERQANPGMEVRPDLPNPLFVVTDPGRVWVTVDLPERLLGKVEVGHAVAIETDAYPDIRFIGRIEKIAPALDPLTRRVVVRCSVDNTGARLKPEMFARVTLLAQADRTALRIPNTALVSDGLYSYVFVEQLPGVLKKRRVALVAQDREFSYTIDSLQAGERIVTGGALLLNSELGVAK